MSAGGTLAGREAGVGSGAGIGVGGVGAVVDSEDESEVSGFRNPPVGIVGATVMPESTEGAIVEVTTGSTNSVVGADGTGAGGGVVVAVEVESAKV